MKRFSDHALDGSAIDDQGARLCTGSDRVATGEPGADGRVCCPVCLRWVPVDDAMLTAVLAEREDCAALADRSKGPGDAAKAIRDRGKN